MTDTVEFTSFTKIVEKKTKPKLNHCNIFRRKKRRDISSKGIEHNDRLRLHFHWAAIFGGTCFNGCVRKVVTERISMRKSYISSQYVKL